MSFIKNINIDKLEKPFVIILVGPPLSGKTTLLRNEFSDVDYELVSRDQILLDEYGIDNYNDAFKYANQKEVDKILKHKLQSFSNSGKNVIIDMTNLTPKRRMYNLSFFKGYYKMAIVFNILSMDEYKNRNNKRSIDENKTIPLSVLENMIKSYQPIKKEEGFDKVISL